MDVSAALLQAARASPLGAGEWVATHHDELCAYLARVGHEAAGRSAAHVKRAFPALGQLLAALLPHLARSAELAAAVAALDVHLLQAAGGAPADAALSARIAAWAAVHVQEALGPGGERAEEALLSALGAAPHELSRAAADARHDALAELARCAAGGAAGAGERAASALWPLMHDERVAAAVAAPLALLSHTPPLSRAVRPAVPLAGLLATPALAEVWRTHPPELLEGAIQDQIDRLTRQPATPSSGFAAHCEGWAAAVCRDSARAAGVERLFRSVLCSPHSARFSHARLYSHYHAALRRLQEPHEQLVLQCLSAPVAAWAQHLALWPRPGLLTRLAALLPVVQALPAAERREAWLCSLRLLLPTLHAALATAVAPAAPAADAAAATRYLAWLLVPMSAPRRSALHRALHATAQAMRRAEPTPPAAAAAMSSHEGLAALLALAASPSAQRSRDLEAVRIWQVCIRVLIRFRRSAPPRGPRPRRRGLMHGQNDWPSMV